MIPEFERAYTKEECSYTEKEQIEMTQNRKQAKRGFWEWSKTQRILPDKFSQPLTLKFFPQ